MEQQDPIKLETLAGGAALERFDYELQRVFENIMDPNTRPDLVRNVTLKVTFRPNKDRNFGPVTIEAAAKLAPLEGHTTQAYFGRDAQGNPTAVEHNPEQYKLFDEAQRQDNVTPIKKKGKE